MPAFLLVAAWALIGLAWAFGNPPFAAPDEGSHYVRAVSIGEGQLIGRETAAPLPAKTARQRDWLAQSTREVDLPARLAPIHDPGCYVNDPSRSAACLKTASVPPPAGDRSLTVVGNYQPLPYLLPAGALRLGAGAEPALRWGRLAGLLPALALLALAVALLWDPASGPVSLLGAIAAVTPMVLFCAASLTGSGLEIAAGIAFIAALLRLRREQRRAADPPGWVWAGAAVSGGALALSRSATPVWLVLALGLWVALLGPRATWSFVRRRRAAWAAGGAVLGGLVLNRTWEALYGPDAPLSLVNARQGLEDGFGQLRGSADQLVLGPGYLEYSLPLWATLLWLAIVLAPAAAAFVAAGSRRDRVVLIATAVAVPSLPIVLWVLTIRHTGFGMQGRHVLPILVALPLLAGELVRERRDSVAAGALRALLVAVPIAAALVQFAAWWRNAQRSAFGLDHSIFAWASPQWSPPAGWGLWMLLAGAGAALLAASQIRRPPPVAGARVSERP